MVGRDMDIRAHEAEKEPLFFGAVVNEELPSLVLNISPVWVHAFHSNSIYTRYHIDDIFLDFTTEKK